MELVARFADLSFALNCLISNPFSAQLPGVARLPPSFFASPKKEGKERRPRSRWPFGLPVCANQKMGSERNSPAAQTAFTSFSIFCFAQTAASQRAPIVRLAFGIADLASVQVTTSDFS
ncbi:MAG: hypothetical protein Q7T66_09725 [Herminiimonas sp.]|uniref:hypothetical protein n=1 Tax=Herminiimonas sp. TaxID=1926289 RepID=UPI002720F234|nr:hypothetical protein [Herminiimonas sp.]MDO9420929.1 hypothetical protein [Herminiimonas sp.]